MSTLTVDLFCFGCGTPVPGVPMAKVAAGLTHRCGSTDLDIHDPESAEQRPRRQANKDIGFVEWMTGKTAIQEGPQGPRRSPVGGDVPGWDEYTGPRPSRTPESNGVGTPYVCPVCHGTGFDLQEGGVCRMCGGAKVITPNADEEQEVPAVARHDYPSTQTKVPYMGRKRTPVLELDKAACTRCARPTRILADAARHAWWHCAACGPLADLDANPHLNPYRPPAQFVANGKGFTTGKHAAKHDGLVTLITAIRQHNPGMSAREILALGRQTLTYARNAEAAETA